MLSDNICIAAGVGAAPGVGAGGDMPKAFRMSKIAPRAMVMPEAIGLLVS